MMKKVLTAMALGAAIIGGSAMAMAEVPASVSRSLDVLVSVASHADITFGDPLAITISGNTFVEDTTTVSIQSNYDIYVDFSATTISFNEQGGAQNAVLNNMLKYELRNIISDDVIDDFTPTTAADRITLSAGSTGVNQSYTLAVLPSATSASQNWWTLVKGTDKYKGTITGTVTAK